MSSSTHNDRLTARNAFRWTILAVGLIVSALLIWSGESQRSARFAEMGTSIAEGRLASAAAKVHESHRASTRPIESLRVGDRVLASNPEITEKERSAWQEPNWEDWVQVSLKMPLPNEDPSAEPDFINIELLRPELWFIDQLGFMLDSVNAADEEDDDVLGATTILESRQMGRCFAPLRPLYQHIASHRDALSQNFKTISCVTLALDLPEMGATGVAVVTAINPSPQICRGEGNLVTATFSHPPSTSVLDVSFEGESKEIAVTDNHPFWSADRLIFAPIGEMSVGERVLTFRGDTKRIESKLPRPGPQLVYNLEVYGEHVYHVGEQGILVHNNYTRKDFNKIHKLGDKLTGMTIAKKKAYLERAMRMGVITADQAKAGAALRTMNLIARRSRRIVGQNPNAYLSAAQKTAMSKKGKYFLRNMFLGKAVEVRMNQFIQANPVLRSNLNYIANGAGKSTVDWVGRGGLRGWNFDLTTLGQRSGKYAKYDDILVPIYDSF